MTYQNEGIQQRAEIVVGATDSLRYQPKVDGVPMVPTSATFALYDPAGSPLAAASAIVPAATTGQLVKTQAWPEATYPICEDYCALWTWTLDGVTYTDRQYFDVVRTKLQCLVDTNNLIDMWPNLLSHLVAIKETDANKFIRQGWSYMLDQIRSGHNRPSLIADKARLINPGIQIAGYFTAQALVRTVGDLWDTRAKQCFEMYEKLYAGLGELKYDRNEDNVIQQDDVKRINRRKFTV